MFLLALVLSVVADGTAVEFGKLKAVAPASWKVEKPANRLRSHQFKLASPNKDFADAELIVLPQSNGNAEKVFPGWKGQFDPPDGKTIDDVTKKDTFTVGTAKVQTLDVSGTWKFKERPQDPKSKLEIRPEYRSIWFIVTVGDESWHVRFSGPQSVVAKHYDDVLACVKSLK